MTKITKHFLNMIIFMFLITLGMVGCGSAQRPIPDRNQVDINQQRIDRINLEDKKADSPLYMALEKEIKSMVGIKDAVVIMGENTAYIGIEGDENTNINNMKGLQAEIARRVRSMTTDIERIYITSDMNGVEKLKIYREQINNGRPLKELLTEIEALF